MAIASELESMVDCPHNRHGSPSLTRHRQILRISFCLFLRPAVRDPDVGSSAPVRGSRWAISCLTSLPSLPRTSWWPQGNPGVLFCESQMVVTSSEIRRRGHRPGATVPCQTGRARTFGWLRLAVSSPACNSYASPSLFLHSASILRRHVFSRRVACTSNTRYLMQSRSVSIPLSVCPVRQSACRSLCSGDSPSVVDFVMFLGSACTTLPQPAIRSPSLALARRT